MAMDHSPGKQFNTMGGAGGKNKGLSIGGSPNAGRVAGAHANVAQPPSKRQSSKLSKSSKWTRERNKKSNEAPGVPGGGVAAAKNAHSSAPAGGASAANSAGAGGDPPRPNRKTEGQPRECNSHSPKSTTGAEKPTNESGVAAKKPPPNNAVLCTSGTGVRPAASHRLVLADQVTSPRKRTTGASPAFASPAFASSPGRFTLQRVQRAPKSSAGDALFLPPSAAEHQTQVQEHQTQVQLSALPANPTMLDQLKVMAEYIRLRKNAEGDVPLDLHYNKAIGRRSLLAQIQAQPPYPQGFAPAVAQQQQLAPRKRNTFLEDRMARFSQRCSEASRTARANMSKEQKDAWSQALSVSHSRSAQNRVSNGTHQSLAVNSDNGKIHFPTKVHELMHNEDGMVTHSKTGATVTALQSTTHVHDGKSLPAFTIARGMQPDLGIKFWELKQKEGEKMAAFRIRGSGLVGRALYDYFHSVKRERVGYRGATTEESVFWHPQYDGTLLSAGNINIKVELRDKSTRRERERQRAARQKEEDDSDGSDSDCSEAKQKAKKRKG